LISFTKVEKLPQRKRGLPLKGGSSVGPFQPLFFSFPRFFLLGGIQVTRGLTQSVEQSRAPDMNGDLQVTRIPAIKFHGE